MAKFCRRASARGGQKGGIAMQDERKEADKAVRALSEALKSEPTGEDRGRDEHPWRPDEQARALDEALYAIAVWRGRGRA